MVVVDDVMVMTGPYRDNFLVVVVPGGGNCSEAHGGDDLVAFCSASCGFEREMERCRERCTWVFGGSGLDWRDWRVVERVFEGMDNW
jgi:hypothetical protein